MNVISNKEEMEDLKPPSGRKSGDHALWGAGGGHFHLLELSFISIMGKRKKLADGHLQGDAGTLTSETRIKRNHN